MKRECLKCGSINTMAKGGAMEACPICGAIYAKVEAARAAKPPSAPDVIDLGANIPPIPKPTQPVAAPQPPTNEWKPPPKGARKNSALPWIVGAIVVLYYSGKVANYESQPSTSVTPIAAAPKQKEVVDISPGAMLAGYRANEVRQDAAMEGRLIRVSSTVKSIKKSAFGGMMIHYAIPGDREDLVINAADDQTAKVSALNIGQESMVICDHFAFVFGGPVGYECNIVR